MSKKKQQGKWPSGLSKALTLEERVLLLRSGHRVSVSGRQIARARQIIQTWKQRKPFEAGDAFACRLRALQIDEDTLAMALAMPVTGGVRRYVQQGRLWNAYMTVAMAEPATAGALRYPEPRRAIAVLVQPLLDETLRDLRKGLDTIGAQIPVFDVDRAFIIAADDALDQICRIIEKTCLLELRVAKLRGQLPGATPGERYASYLELLQTQSFRRSIFLEYPTLLETLSERLRFWCTNTLSFLSRMAHDADLIQQHLLDGAAPSMLVRWTTGEGDSHCGGRSVITIMFENGRKIIYKPRPLGVDVGFNRFVEWCNEKLTELPLRTAKVIDRGAYGWCECIETRDLTSASEIRDYYIRQGKFLALFYGLHANDLHCENMIASGSDPVYVDLETLFHPVPGTATNGDIDPSKSIWPPTVNDTFILPAGRRAADGKKGFDISALGASPDQLWPYAVLERTRDGTDEAHMGVVKRTLGSSAHLPKYQGEVVTVHDYVEDVCDGFVAVYDLLQNERSHLLSSNGLLTFFSNVATRHLFRQTALYSRLIEQSLHPDYLRDSLERRALFERLYRDDDEGMTLNCALAAEIRDMEQLDVPYFWRRFDEEAILDSRGIALEGLRLPSPHALVASLLARFNESDKLAQLTLIRIALLPEADNAPRDNAPAIRHPPVQRGMASPPNPFSKSLALADNLLSRSVNCGADRYWMCQMSAGDSSSPGVLNLYDGQLGIALFFGVLSAVTKRPDHAITALQSIDTVRRWSNGGKRGFRSTGVYTGSMGYAYVLANLGLCLRRDDLLDEAFAWLDAFEPHPSRDALDIVAGAAGCVLYLAQMRKHARDRTGCIKRIDELIGIFAETIAHAAQSQDVGVGWLPSPLVTRPLAGFAHGNSGFIAALHVAADTLGRDEYRVLARRALAYEDRCFSTELGNWLDLREIAISSGHDETMCAWCHGAPGVLLGRLISLKSMHADHPDCARLIADARRAIAATVRAYDVNNHSLCHGSLGNLEILAAASAHPALADAAEQFAGAEGTDETHSEQPRCGDLGENSTESVFAAPGLLLGVAGIGYGLLRSAAPRAVPSVLWLEVGPKD